MPCQVTYLQTQRLGHGRLWRPVFCLLLAKTDRQPVISPEEKKKKVYSGSGQELQFCNRGEPCASPLLKGRGELFYRGELNKAAMSFHWLRYDNLSLAELLPGRKRKSFFFLLLGSAIVMGNECSYSWPPKSI